MGRCELSPCAGARRDPRDIALAAGQSVTLDRDGVAVVSSAAAVVCLREPKAKRPWLARMARALAERYGVIGPRLPMGSMGVV